MSSFTAELFAGRRRRGARTHISFACCSRTSFHFFDSPDIKEFSQVIWRAERMESGKAGTLRLDYLT